MCVVRLLSGCLCDCNEGFGELVFSGMSQYFISAVLHGAELKTAQLLMLILKTCPPLRKHPKKSGASAP